MTNPDPAPETSPARAAALSHVAATLALNTHEAANAARKISLLAQCADNIGASNAAACAELGILAEYRACLSTFQR